MTRPALPASLTLPSGRAVRLRLRASEGESAGSATTQRKRIATPKLLFDDALTALRTDERGRVTIIDRDAGAVDVGTMALSDFHALRAILARSGVIEEEEVEITCRNCDASMRVRPSANLEIGPFIDGELDDEELDATLPFGHPVEAGDGDATVEVIFAPRTVEQALPMFAALARRKLVISAEFVTSMGIASLAGERDPERVARLLDEIDDDVFEAIGDAFLASHYPPRLCAVTRCPGCNARNDVDAPYVREIEPSAPRPLGEREADAEAPPRGDFPSFEAFAARAEALAEPRFARVPGDPVELVVEAETPNVDDGGEPLLGSYVPPHPGDMTTPNSPPRVTVYYRTFRAMWDEDGAYDWDDELRETIEHELEHHLYWMSGDDPMDDDERAVIRDEARRVIGRREAERRAIRGLGASLADFAARTWPLWIVLVLAFAAMLASQD